MKITNENLDNHINDLYCLFTNYILLANLDLCKVSRGQKLSNSYKLVNYINYEYFNIHKILKMIYVIKEIRSTFDYQLHEEKYINKNRKLVIKHIAKLNNFIQLEDVYSYEYMSLGDIQILELYNLFPDNGKIVSEI